MGMPERPQNRQERAVIHSVAQIQLLRKRGQVVLLGKDNVESRNSLSCAAELNPEVVAAAHCVGRLDSKVKCRMSHAWSVPSATSE